MSGENETHPRPEEEADRRSCTLQKFKLYETKMNFYMVGTDKRRTMWRVLKIDRSEPTELNILEDCTKYSENECRDLLQRIHEGNRSIGGLKLVTNCYGIVGFIKFLGPYYMLIITRRKKIGAICGHTIYAVTKSEIIALPNNSWQSNMGFSKNENRYKKLLCTVDLTKDFFFSYTYHVMRCLQKNLCNDQTGHVLYETMFVWNEFLTRGIRIHLKNTLWTVALVYGFFKQEKLSISGKEFKLTLIARRSRYYAGTRYLKRGVNEKGRVANDVETEQIVFEDVPKGFPTQISSVVQNRGSIPLFWSQETSRLNIKPDIILHKREQNFEATRLHFQNLVNRYGNPIIILNLIKTREKRPRESILRAEFANAIDIINKDLSDDNRLRFLHWDLHKHARRNATNVLALLGKVTSYALNITGFLYFQVAPSERLEGALKCPLFLKNESLEKNINETLSGTESQEADIVVDKKFVVKPAMFQKGILRTNCIDCLDRTNVAQYAYGLAALGSQLHALGFTDVANIDLDDPLADDLMKFYETMGDTLALQYGGSAAHNKIFSERRGQWKAATQSQEFLRTLQRYYSNAYVDAEKQDAINVFLGYFQPQQGKPELWELKSDQHYNKRTPAMVDENARLSFKRSLSDGNILCESNTPVTNPNVGQKKYPNSALPATTHQGGMGTSEMLSCENDISLTRFNPSMPRRQLFPDRGSENGEIYFSEYMAGDGLNCTNFVDVDWLSSSANSCEEEGYDGSMHVDSPIATMSSENVVNGISVETIPFPSEIEFVLKEKEQTEIKPDYDYNKNSKDLGEFSDRFIWWVTNGETLCH